MCALLIPLHIHIALNVFINITIKNQMYQNIYRNKEDIKKVPNKFYSSSDDNALYKISVVRNEA